MNLLEPETLPERFRILERDRDPMIGRLRFCPTMADRQNNMPGLRCEDRVIGDCELIYYVGGLGEVILSGRRYACRAGTVLLIRPWEVHSINSSLGSPHDNFWTHFTVEPDYLTEAVTRAAFPDSARVAEIGLQENLIGLFANLDHEIAAKAQAYPEAATALFTAIFLRVWRAATGSTSLPAPVRARGQSEVQGAGPGPEEALLCAIESFVRKRLAEPLDTETLCREFAIGRTSLFTLFRRARGMGPASFIRRERLRAAELLLKTGDLPLKDIAGRSGFADAFHLSHAFKEVYGASPRDWLASLHA